MSPLVRIRELSRRFGGSEALAPVSLDLSPGEVLAITGPNGAGKSTLLACIAGQVAPSTGSVLLGDRDITMLPAHARAALGMAMAFQRPTLMPDRSAADNVGLGRHRHATANLASLLLGGATARAERAARWASALHYLEQVGLRAESERPVATLSYGEQKRVDLARALAAEPRLLLVDEPCAGAGPTERARIVQALAAARDRGTAVVLVEHHPDVVEALADRTLTLGLAPPTAAIQIGPGPVPGRAPALTIEDLTVVARTGARILEAVTLSVAQGEVVSVSGANATGKTTLLGAVAGLRAPEHGRIRLDTTAIDAWPVHRRARAGVVLADRTRTLFGDLSVQDNLQASTLGQPREEAQRRIEALLTRTPALGPRLGQRTSTLSGGEQQLLAAAKAVLAQPRVLLADEPLLGLDAAAVTAVLELLWDLAKTGTAVLITEQTPSGGASRQLHLSNGQLSAP